MVFAIQSRDERFLEKVYKQSMGEFEDFFGLKWKRNKPKVFLVKDRKTINKLRERKTEDWVVGWVNNTDVFVLDKDAYEKESCHKYSGEGYSRLIKHELAHAFFLIASDFRSEPCWLWEGIAIYLSGQNKTKKKPSKLKEFLQHYSRESINSSVYNESGFAVEFLVKNHGKQKILKLIKALKELDSEEKFSKKFKEIYSFRLDYKNFKNHSGTKT